MQIQLERIQDKIEFFEAVNLPALEKSINEQIEINKALLLEVHSVTHQIYKDSKTERPIYTAVVHFKAKAY